MSKLRTLTGLAALCGLFAIACGDGASDDGPGNGAGLPPPSLVGVWVFQSVNLDGMPADLANVLDWVPGTAAAELQILENGAFVYQEVDSSGAQLSAESGFVLVNDAGEVDLTVQRDEDGVVDGMLSFRFTVTDDTLMLHEVGSTLVFMLMRAPEERHSPGSRPPGGTAATSGRSGSHRNSAQAHLPGTFPGFPGWLANGKRTFPGFPGWLAIVAET